MSRSMRGLRTAAQALVVCLAVVLLAPAAASAAEKPVFIYGSTEPYEHESEQAFEQQLAEGQIRAVTINKRMRRLRVTLKDGSHMLAKYPPKQEPRVARAIKAKGVRLNVLSKKQSEVEQNYEHKKKGVHHKLRYIAGGILLVVIVVVGAVLMVRRRREGDSMPRGADPQPDPD